MFLCIINFIILENYTEYNINTTSFFNLLLLTENQLNIYHTLQQFSVNNYHIVKSIYISPANQYYHLHPELVNNNVTIQLCNTCKKQLIEGKIPKLSIAASIDYRNYHRLFSDMKPTLAEVVLIFLVYMYCLVVKVTTAPNVAGHSYFSEHVIAFSNNGHEVSFPVASS